MRDETNNGCVGRKAEKGLQTSDFRLQTSVLCSAVSFQLIFLEIKSHFSADFRFHSTRNLCFISKAEKGLHDEDFRLQTSDFRLQTSDFRLQISDFRLQTSDFRL